MTIDQTDLHCEYILFAMNFGPLGLQQFDGHGCRRCSQGTQMQWWQEAKELHEPDTTGFGITWTGQNMC